MVKLCRFGARGSERPGLVDDQGLIRDLSEVVTDIAGDALDPFVLQQLGQRNAADLPLVPEGTRLGPCVGASRKFLCVGLNYADHARETNMPLPAEPVLFMKATSAITGPNDDLHLPRGSKKTDWEVELGVVIGRTARHVGDGEALAHVAGYCVINDLSERAFQLEGTGQWVKGKSCDGFGPIGPWLVTPDEIGDVQNLPMHLAVNGEVKQQGSTATMHFSVAFLISYISRFMTLEPGDIISTGTPPGVGMGFDPPTYLRPGDVVDLGIGGLGRQRQRVLAPL
jgi:2-keto-4-pentenoate hydratase/2-oxohepta-3-ene-1,7-dioic acid hydratase in catechol pathway